MKSYDAMITQGVELRELNGERLIMESAAGDIEKVSVLIGYGADVNMKRHTDGRTALMEASTRGYSEIVKLLKETGSVE